jgi:hypothetical protein
MDKFNASWIFVIIVGFTVLAVWLGYKAYVKWKKSPPDILGKK